MNTLILGIGNEWRQDDGVGPAVVRGLGGIEGITVRVVAGAGLELWQAWEGFARVTIVDAMYSGLPPGSVRCQRWDEVIEGSFSRSTHDLSLGAVFELAKEMGCLPASLEVFGVEGATFGYGRGLSSEVARVVPVVARKIRLSLLNERGGVHQGHQEGRSDVRVRESCLRTNPAR